MTSREEEQEFQWASRKIAVILDTLRTLPEIGRAADIGCRTGNEAAYYRDQAGIGEMHGFEIDEAPLEVARSRGIVPHVWVSGETPCPVRDATFDAVIAGDIIEHLFDTDVFLEELYRVIRPGGHLIVTTPNLAWWWSRLRLLRGRVPGGMGPVSPRGSADPAIDIKHLRVSIAREWEHLFRSHGFTIVNTLGFHYPGLLRGPLDAVDRMVAGRPALAHSNLFLVRK